MGGTSAVPCSALSYRVSPFSSPSVAWSPVSVIVWLGMRGPLPTVRLFSKPWPYVFVAILAFSRHAWKRTVLQLPFRNVCAEEPVKDARASPLSVLKESGQYRP